MVEATGLSLLSTIVLPRGQDENIDVLFAVDQFDPPILADDSRRVFQANS